MTQRVYVYDCPNPDCKSGEYKTTVPPHTFPRCMWCGRVLNYRREAAPPEEKD